jgi:hypothetical protein
MEGPMVVKIEGKPDQTFKTGQRGWDRRGDEGGSI